MVDLHQNIIIMMMSVMSRDMYKQRRYNNDKNKRRHGGRHGGRHGSRHGGRDGGRHNNILPFRPREQDKKVFVIKNKYTRNLLPIQSENFARHGQPWPSIVAFRKPSDAREYMKRCVSVGRFIRFRSPSQHLVYEPILFEDILFICHYLAVVHLTILEEDGKMRTFPCRYENDMEVQRMALAFLLSQNQKETF